MPQLQTYCAFRPKAYKEEKDPGSHSLCIGSQADKEGKVEKVKAGGIGGLGGEKKLKILQLYVMGYDASRWKRGESHVITNGNVLFCCRPSARWVPEKHPRNWTFVQRWRWKSWLLSLLVTSLMCLQLSTVIHVSLPGPGELSYRKIPNNSRGVYVGPGSNLWQAFNSFLSKIQDENVTNFSSFSVNYLASFYKWSCCGVGNDSAYQHSRQTPHLCCHSRWHTFVSPSPWSSCGTLSRGVPICWSPIPACLSQAPH